MQDPPTETRQEPKDRLQEVRQMVSEVTVIMKDNLEKVVERDEKLNTLSVRTKELEASVSTIHRDWRTWLCNSHDCILLNAMLEVIFIYTSYAGTSCKSISLCLALQMSEQRDVFFMQLFAVVQAIMES